MIPLLKKAGRKNFLLRRTLNPPQSHFFKGGCYKRSIEMVLLLACHAWIYSQALPIFALVLLLAFPFTVSAEKIRTVVPQSSVNYLSVYVAESRGLFHQEGFEHETLVLAGPVAAAALVSGNVDFGGGGGSAMRAAAGGRRCKAIFFQTDKVTFYLVSDGEIAKAADLKGKRIGVGGIGLEPRPAHHNVCRTSRFAQRYHAHRHGRGRGRRILAIKSGRINATMLDPGTVIFRGKRRAAHPGVSRRFVSLSVSGLRRQRSKVARQSRASQKMAARHGRALMFVRDNPEERGRDRAKTATDRQRCQDRL